MSDAAIVALVLAIAVASVAAGIFLSKLIERYDARQAQKNERASIVVRNARIVGNADGSITITSKSE